jgi:hypothetical protein
LSKAHWRYFSRLLKKGGAPAFPVSDAAKNALLRSCLDEASRLVRESLFSSLQENRFATGFIRSYCQSI